MADETESTSGMTKTELEKKVEELTKRVADLESKDPETRDRENRMKKISEYSEQQLKHQREHNKVLLETAKILGDTFAESRQRVELAEKELELLKRQKIEGMGAEEQEEFNKGLEKAKKEIREFGQIMTGANTERGKEFEDMLKDYKEQVDLEEGLKAIREDGVVLADKMAASLGIQKKYKDSIFGTTVSLLSKLNEEGIEGERARKAMKKYLVDLFSYKNIALNIFDAIKDNSIELFGAFDKAQASLAAATGQGDKFRGTLYEVGREGNLFGVSMDDAGKAIGTLVDQTSNFTSMSKATQANLALNVAKMQKLGVATSDSAKIFQNFNQALGMTAEESMNLQTELAMAGVSIGINAGKMTKDFNASLSTLMVYGRESVDVFKGIAAAAKAAGVETSTLLQIAGKFDTFSGAAEGAGKLNALLGTQLSTTEMLMATEDERIRMLVESVQSQGVAFQDMDRFTQKAIANAAGITDMAEANRIFGMSLEAYDENERKLNASANAQKKLDDAVAKTVPVMDQFKKLGAEIVVALEPFLENIEGVAKGMTDFFKSMDTEDKEMLASTLSFFTGLVLVWPILKMAFAGLQMAGLITLPALGAGAGTAAGPLTALGGAFLSAAWGAGTFATALSGITIQALGIAAAVGVVGAAIGVIVYGLAEFADAIGGIFVKIGRGISSVIDSIRGTGEETAQFEARAAEAMASIVAGNHQGALASVKSMVEEVNKMGQDVKVSSTIENLALITAGKASSMTGERVVASQTSVTANVQNFFEGMEMTLMIDDTTALKTYVASVASGEA